MSSLFVSLLYHQLLWLTSSLSLSLALPSHQDMHRKSPSKNNKINNIIAYKIEGAGDLIGCC